MNLKRRHYRDKQTGKKKFVRRWTVRFEDHFGRWISVPAFVNRKASVEFGRKLERLAAMRAAGEQPDLGTNKWLEMLSNKLVERLVKFDLLPPKCLANGRTLEEHLIGWHKSVLAKGATRKHAGMSLSRVRKIVVACGFRRYSEINSERVQEFLADLRQVHGVSVQTSNFYLTHIKSFCQWMCREGRASSNPLKHLTGMNVAVDRRHDRRALTTDEARKLLHAAACGPQRQGTPGPQRALIYRIALETGLRLNELRSLRKVDFDLKVKSPSVTVRAAYAKNHRADTLPLRKDTAELIRDHLATKMPTAQAFSIRQWIRAGDMIRADLQEAGIPYRDASDRVVDFHALRHTFVTNMANAGVHPRLAQKLARHSTITLTMDRYTHTVQEQEMVAISKLPDLSNPVQATGTDNKQHG